MLLDSVAFACLSCLKVIATTANLAEALADLTLENDVYLQSPHIVHSLLNSELTTFHLQVSVDETSCEILLSPANLYLKLYNVLNPATLLPLSHKGEGHDCKVTVSHGNSLVVHRLGL